MKRMADGLLQGLKEAAEDIKPDYSKIHTKVLIKQLHSQYWRDSEDELDIDGIKAELAKRGHVNTKDQSTLIRKMSQKAGKRLTLREAQLMKNKEK